MEDLMHIQTVFFRGLIGKALEKILKKQGYSAKVIPNDIRVSFSSKDRKARIHLDIDAEIDEKDLLDILNKIGII